MGDGSTVQRQYDKFGNVTTTTVSGMAGATVTEIKSNNIDGQEIYIQHPEGNSVTTTYDSSNPIFRSHGNVKQIKVDPGPRGGPSYTATFNFDARYNLQSGDQVDANGYHSTYTLTLGRQCGGVR